MADVNWPGALLVPADAKLSPIGFNISGGSTFDLAEQIASGVMGRWKLELSKIYLSQPAQVGAWNAIEAALGGRFGTIDMPIFDYPRAPWPLVRGQQVTTGAPIAAIVMADVDPDSQTAYIEVQNGAALQGYEHFGFNERVYRIVQILNVYGGGAYPIYTVQFVLPCREIIPAGSPIDFNDPILRCRLEADDSMAIKGGYNLWRRAAPDLTLWEDI